MPKPITIGYITGILSIVGAFVTLVAYIITADVKSASSAHSAHIRIDRIEGQLDRIEGKTEKIYDYLIK